MTSLHIHYKTMTTNFGFIQYKNMFYNTIVVGGYRGNKSIHNMVYALIVLKLFLVMHILDTYVYIDTHTRPRPI